MPLGSGYTDPRSRLGMFSRGPNVYNGGTNNATSGPLNGGGGGAGIRRWPGINPMAPQPQMPTSSSSPSDSENPYTFDPIYAAAQRRLQQQLAELASTQELGERRINQGFDMNKAALDRSRSESSDRLQSKMSSQGLLRSGINVSEQADLGSQFQRMLEQLTTGRDNAAEDLTRTITGGRQELTSAIEQLELAQSRAQQEAALRAAEEAARREAQQDYIRQIEELINSMTQPNAQGQYDLQGAAQTRLGG